MDRLDASGLAAPLVNRLSFDSLAPPVMQRRRFLQAALGLVLGKPLFAQGSGQVFEAAGQVLQSHVEAGRLDAAVFAVRHRDTTYARSFGGAADPDAIFLLASITKPIVIAAVMSLHDEGAFQLEDRVGKFIGEFHGEGREQVTMRHLMTHISGLPDQLPENVALRSQHADLSRFVDGAMRTPMLFAPGTRYSYSSMGILLAAEVAQRISGKPIAALVSEVVFEPLRMTRSALGIGHLDPDSLVRCQVEQSAPEAGAGDPESTRWDWNSDYWRRLGAPWGGAHGSAHDVIRFLDAFMNPTGKLLKEATARQMIVNQNPAGLRSRGLGFDLGNQLGDSLISARSFGHSGSTGTLCWADPQSDTVCVVLTTLPAQAMRPHPRDLVSASVARTVARSAK